MRQHINICIYVRQHTHTHIDIYVCRGLPLSNNKMITLPRQARDKPSTRESAENGKYFFSHLYIKCIVLPRQARDKHRESTQIKCVPPPIASERLRENGTFVEFSLCLSRACLGKIMHFIYKWRKKCRFLTGTSSSSSIQPCAESTAVTKRHSFLSAFRCLS